MRMLSVSYLEWHCSHMLKALRFGTSDEGCFFVFGVLKTKNLAFSTLDASALKSKLARSICEVGT